jgi:hypothetical protein
MKIKQRASHAPSARFLRWTPEAIRYRALCTNLALHVLARSNRLPPIRVARP